MHRHLCCVLNPAVHAPTFWCIRTSPSGVYAPRPLVYAHLAFWCIYTSLSGVHTPHFLVHIPLSLVCSSNRLYRSPTFPCLLFIQVYARPASWPIQLHALSSSRRFQILSCIHFSFRLHGCILTSLSGVLNTLSVPARQCLMCSVTQLYISLFFFWCFNQSVRCASTSFSGVFFSYSGGHPPLRPAYQLVILACVLAHFFWCTSTQSFGCTYISL